MSRYGVARRSVLRAGSTLLVATLAGCTTGADPNDSPPSRSTDDVRAEGDRSTDRADGVASSEDAGPNATDVPTVDAAGVESTSTSGLWLPTADVDASPGGLVDVAPSGAVIVLDFFATWCPPCGPEMANLRAVRDRFDEDVFVVSITQETDEAAIEAFWSDHDATWPVAMDPDLRATRAYGVRTIPTIVVLDRAGTETARHTGLVGESTLVEAIDAALGAD